MNNIVNALNYIDDDLVFAALQTVRSGVPDMDGAHGRKAKIKLQSSQRAHGGTKVKVIAIGATALAVCTVIIVYAVFSAGNHAEDPYAHGHGKSLSDFSEIYDLYPDREMADRLSSLDYDEYDKIEIDLSYGVAGKESDWQNTDEWNSLIFNMDIIEDSQRTESAQIICLFEETFDYWYDLAHFDEKDVSTLSYGQTTVYLIYDPTGRHNIINYCETIFEKNDVIYDVSTFAYADADSRERMYEILGILLNE